MKLICIENDVRVVTSLVKMTLFINKATYKQQQCRLLHARGGSYYLIFFSFEDYHANTHITTTRTKRRYNNAEK